MDWIRDNLEWIVGGAVATFVAICGLLASARFRSSRRQDQKGGKGSVNLQAGKNIKYRRDGK
ncbi:hypothetical protein GCM10009789_19330 [Kribbella sancticallisti]|uniref:Uncharacterized protein n=1 Tax=Kribbella sancticallisti TaxID=460087 RepID=A0ABP4NR77_9ACTN